MRDSHPLALLSGIPFPGGHRLELPHVYLGRWQPLNENRPNHLLCFCHVPDDHAEQFF